MRAAESVAGTGLCGSTVTPEQSCPVRGDSCGVCNGEAPSPKCWLLMSKKVIKIIVCIIAPVSKSREVYALFPSSVFLLVLCKRSFSLGSSWCPRIILELKDTSCHAIAFPVTLLLGWFVAGSFDAVD